MQHDDNSFIWKGRALMGGSVLLVGSVLAACSGGSSSAHDATSTTGAPATTSTSTTTPTSTSTTTDGTRATSAVTAAVDSYQAANGPSSGWEITSSQTSTVDPTYVLFKLGPAPGYEASYQGGYGFVHQQSSGTWSVIGFGTAGVGCTASGSSSPAVPTPVLTGFGLGCPA